MHQRSTTRKTKRNAKRTVCRGGRIQINDLGEIKAGTRKCKRGRCLPMIGRRLSINRAGWMIGGGFDVLSSYH